MLVLRDVALIPCISNTDIILFFAVGVKRSLPENFYFSRVLLFWFIHVKYENKIQMYKM